MTKTGFAEADGWEEHPKPKLNIGREFLSPSDRAKRQQYMTEHDEDYAHFEENRPRQGPGHIE